ncbi:MAG: cytochrome P450 [Pseudomonadota bacterium]
MSPRLPMGENVLAIDWPRRHAEEREVLEQVLDHNHDKDHLRIRKIVRDRVKKALPTERSELRKLNIARFCEDVALDVAGRYLGIGDLCEREDLRPIVRRLASQVFQAPVHGSIEERDARLAGSRMAGLAKHYVDEAVDQFECCQKHDEDWTITDRLLHAVARENVPSISAHRRNWVTRNMATLAVFGSVTTARAMTQAIYQIHLYPERWKIARHAAKTYEDVAVKFDGPAEEHPVDAVSELKTAREDLLMVIFEALRWHPMLPVLGVRTAIRDTLLAPGNDARTPVRAGTKVLPVLMAAMHDGETFRHPECFCPKARNKDDYLHFGAGPHECVGRHMAEAMLIEIAAAFFTDDLIGARYRKTTAIEYDGPAVNALWFQPC